MHDLSALETNEQFGDFEWENEGNNEVGGQEMEMSEEAELEAAGELLSVGNEAEVDQFLGGLIGKIAGQLGKVVKGPLGNALGGTLKAVARSALPMVATAIGGPVGGLVASGAVDTAMKAFGLELEGLSQEDQELEIARRYVKLANGTIRRALLQPLSQNPRNQVLPAVRWAMRRYAPGLLNNWSYPSRYRPYYRPGGLPPYGPDNSYGAQTQTGYPEYAPPPAGCPVCGSPAAPDPGATDHPTEAASTPPPPAMPAAPTSSEMEDEYYLGGYGGSRGGGYPGGYSGYSGGYAGGGNATGSSSGRWIRRGNKIVLYGA